jgi:hypothetical protein
MLNSFQHPGSSRSAVSRQAIERFSAPAGRPWILREGAKAQRRDVEKGGSLRPVFAALRLPFENRRPRRRDFPAGGLSGSLTPVFIGAVRRAKALRLSLGRGTSAR